MIHMFKYLSIFLILFGLQNGAVAQAPVKVEEGFDYRVLTITQPIDTKGKVEVIEFFGMAARIVMSLSLS